MSYSENATVTLPLSTYYAYDTEDGVRPALLDPRHVRKAAVAIGECAWTMLGCEHVRRA